MTDRFIVAHPGSLLISETVAAARELAHKHRDTSEVLIFKIVQVEQWPARTPEKKGGAS